MDIDKKNTKYIKLITVGALTSIIVLCLSVAVLYVGKITSSFGDPFYSNKIFHVTKKAKDNIRFKPKVNSKSVAYTKEGDKYIFRKKIGKWVEVDLIVKDNNGEIKNIPFFPGSYMDNDSINAQGFVYIYESLGEVVTPFELSVNNALAENNTADLKDYDLGPLTFFTQRSNLNYIYYFMIALVWFFGFIVFNRLYLLWLSYSNQDQIDDTIINSNTRLIALKKLSKENTNLVPQKFISALHLSFIREGSTSKFSEIYQDFIHQSENKDYDFSEKMRKNNVWIIRSGIFGTLVGLIIALFELYIAMYGVNIGTDTPLSSEFITQIQQALLGNALAIGTSITAHGAGLLMELFVGSLIQNESQGPWLTESYNKVLRFKEYSNDPSEPIEIANQFKIALGEMNEVLDKVNEEIQTLPENMKSANQLFSGMNKNLQNTSSTLEVLKQSIDQANQHTNRFSETFILINRSTNQLSTTIINADTEINKIQKDSNLLLEKINQSSSLISNKTRAIFSSFNNLLGGLSKNLASLKESMDKDQDISD